MNETRIRIMELVQKAECAIPEELLPDLPPGVHTLGAPGWHMFENQVWKCGEDIRQLLTVNKSLRKELELQRAFLRVACNRKAKRGRQSFIMLLGYVFCSQHASDIASQLSDSQVAGHAIDTITKMRNPDFVKDIEPFTKSKTSWVRNKAKKYLERYG